MVRWPAVAFAFLLMAGCLGKPADDEGAAPDVSITRTDCLAGVGGLDLNTATIADLQAALTLGNMTSLELVDAYIARIMAFDQADSTGPLNSIREVSATAREQARILDAERAAGSVRGPLHGIPILLKDNINTFDQPTTAGSIALANNVPPKDATVTERLRDAGAIILGKTNMVEFASMMTSHPLEPPGYSSLGGQVVNAYNGGNPLGSSSGSGVAGSMAFAAITLGTETSGSITGPSSVNSLVGLKTTTGLVSRAGVIPLALSFDTVGPMGRNVADVATALDAMAGTDALDARTAEADAHLPPGGFMPALTTDALQGARLGYDPDYTDPFFVAAVDALGAAGAVMVVIQSDFQAETSTGPQYDYNEFKFGIDRYLATEAGPGAGVADLTDIILYNQEHMDRVPYGQDKLIAADATPGDWSLANLAITPETLVRRASVDAVFQDNDLDAIVHIGEWLGVGDFLGYPTLVVPAGYDGLLPEGIGFFGQAWSDGDLLAYGHAYEQATNVRIPPTVLNSSLVQGIC